ACVRGLSNLRATSSPGGPPASRGDHDTSVESDFEGIHGFELAHRGAHRALVSGDSRAALLFDRHAQAGRGHCRDGAYALARPSRDAHDHDPKWTAMGRA